MGKNLYDWSHLRKIRQYPHILGWLAGKDKLTPMHSEWCRYLWEAEDDVCLRAHRGAYKTTINIEIGIPWWLLFHPNNRIAIVRKTFTGSSEIMRNITNIMMMDTIYPLFELAWGEPNWKFRIKRSDCFEVSAKKTKTKEASVTALGLDSSMTGSHYDDIICDDFIDKEDRQSEAERARTKMVIQELRTNIADPGKRVMYQGTPWHRHDCWEILPPAKDYPVSATGLLTPAEIAKKKEKTTKILYAINYDLKFENDADLMFANPHMGVWHDDNTDIKAHIDAAYKGDHFCALTIIGRQKNDRLNLVGFVSDGNIKDWFSFIIQKLVQYNVREVYSEDNADRGYTNDILELNPILRQKGIWMNSYHEPEKKSSKIINYLGEIFKQTEFAQESDPDYIEQVSDWREGEEPDDAPDSAASLAKNGGYSIIAFTNQWNVWNM